MRWASGVFLLVALVARQAAAAPVFSDRAFGGDPLNPGDDMIIVQVIRVTGDPHRDATIEFVHIRNAGTATSAQIEKIYLVWESAAPTSPVFSQTPSATINLANQNLQIGVIRSTNFAVPKGSTRYLWVGVKVAAASALEEEATVLLKTNLYWYTAVESGNSGFLADGKPETIVKAGWEEVVDGSPAGNTLNPGDEALVHKFTARDRDANAAGLTITTVRVRRAPEATATASDLAEIRVVIGHGTTNYVAQTTNTGGWDSPSGVTFTSFTPSLPEFVDGSQISVAVYVTVAQESSDGRTVISEVVLETEENEQTTSKTITAPSVWTIRRAGPEEAEELSVPPTGLGINPGERLTQRVWVADRDHNGKKFQITHLWIRNLGTAETADIAGLAVWMGNTQIYTAGWPPSTYDFRTGGWIPVTALQVSDEGEAILTLEYRVSPLATTGRTLRPEVKVGSFEPPTPSPGTSPQYSTPALAYPAAVTIHPAGFEVVENVAIEPGTVYSTQRFVAQKLRLQDSDGNNHGVTITRIHVRNVGTALDTQFTRLEVRQAGATGALLAETTNLSGLRATGISLTPATNNTVGDDATLELWIWLTLAGPETTVVGRTIQLETTLSFTEGPVSGETPARRGPEFTVAVNNPPVVQDFTWTPANPQYGQEITFTPGAVTDPDNDAIVYSRWDFGEGADPRYVERDGPPQQAVTKYPDGGTFAVTLLVRDAKGLEGSKTKSITVTLRPNTAPTVDFTWSPAEPAVGQTVTFAPTVTDPDNPPDAPFTFAWSFGANATPSTSTAQAPSVVFNAAGPHTVRLEVTDRRGARGVKEKTVNVAAPPQQLPTITGLSADPSYPAAGQTVTFVATATAPANDPITAWRWDFGDGTVREIAESATTLSVTHVYPRVGTYTVSVQARNNAGWSTARTLSIVVRPAGVEFGFLVLDNPVTGNQCRIQIFAPPGATELKLTVLDQAGRPVLLENPVAVGTFTWDLKDREGRTVPNGLYLFYVTAKIGGETRRTEVGRILVRR
ncbi:MAG: PKD domain-containing protein [Candidatus Bipolaricaulota bacterium]|nr:PKD domain-containing protein [Candidatus Bipolaricaulota bacterium]MDW8151983.1 PKD domain-containing protein [Candidatus Bipolaricaulota bacterium]